MNYPLCFPRDFTDFLDLFYKALELNRFNGRHAGTKVLQNESQFALVVKAPG